MKKIIIALAAVAAFASCAKSEVEFTPDQQEIALAPFTENRTKAMVATTAFPEEKFAVWAFYKQVDKGTTIAAWQASSAAQTTYIDNKPFAPKTTADGTLWGGVTTYFWPKEGSLMFAGYYPVDMKGVTYNFTKDVNTMNVADYTLTYSSTGENQPTGFVNSEGTTYVEDFMYFNMTEASCDASTTGPKYSVTTGNHVDVLFKHALSWINVILAKDANTPDGATITVNSIKFTSISPSGDAVINNSAVPPATKDIVWTADADADAVDVQVCPDNVTLDVGNKEPLAKQPIFIPQTMAGKNLVIEYTISSEDGSSFTETKTVPFTTGTDAWQPGKKYTYTVTIGTTEILIDPIIETWTDVPATVDAK